MELKEISKKVDEERFKREVSDQVKNAKDLLDVLNSGVYKQYGVPIKRALELLSERAKDILPLSKNISISDVELALTALAQSIDKKKEQAWEKGVKEAFQLVVGITTDSLPGSGEHMKREQAKERAQVVIDAILAGQEKKDVDR